MLPLGFRGPIGRVFASVKVHGVFGCGKVVLYSGLDSVGLQFVCVAVLLSPYPFLICVLRQKTLCLFIFPEIALALFVPHICASIYIVFPLLLAPLPPLRLALG